MYSRFAVAFFAAASLSSVVFAVLTGTQSKTVAALAADRRVADLGDVPQNSQSSAAFTLENGSSAEIRIASVYASCSCTEVQIDKKVLPPGISTPLRVKYKSGIGRGDQATYCQVFFFVGDNETIQKLTLGIRANIVPYVNVSKESLVFFAGSAAKETISVSSGLVPKPTITSVDSSHPAFRAELLSDDKLKEQLVRVEFLPEKWAGLSKRNEIVFSIDSPHVNNLRIPVYVKSQ